MKHCAIVVPLVALLSLARGGLPAAQNKLTLNYSLAECFPTSGHAGSWRMTDSLRIYRGKELYRLIDGGADLYEEYGFLQAGSTEYTDESGAEVTVEVYEMADSPAAFGIYSLLTAHGGTRIGIGQEATEGEYYVQMWKGRFLVTITAREVDRWKRDAARELAQYLDRRLEGGGMKPDLVESMSDVDSIFQGIVYLRGSLGLANTWMFWYGNVIRLTEGLTGRTRGGGFLIARYTSGDECSRALVGGVAELTGPQSFAVVSQSAREAVLQEKQGAIVVLARAGRFLFVAGASTQEVARQCIGELQKRVLRPR